jgi:hypothetical protein
MVHPRYRPPDPSQGDESTIGGYAAVHDRPAAFEGSDGFSYSVELMTEESGDPQMPWAGFILFVRWARVGAQSPEGHLETAYLVAGASDSDVRATLGTMPLATVKALLDTLIDERVAGGPSRPWWDAMRHEGGGR